MRKSITTRYFYSTAVLLICSIAVMGFIQMYLAMGYFREENGTALIQTIDNAILAMQEAADDGIVEKRAEAAEAAGLDVEDIKRGITLTARAAGKSILVTDAYGSVVLSIPSEYQGMEVSVKTCNATYSRGIYDEMGTLGGIFSSRYYIAGKPILDEKGMLQGFVFAGANADSLTEYLANLFSTFILSAGLMLMVSSVLSIVLTNRMTTPLRRISDAAKKFGGGDFSARVPVEGDDELAQLAETFNTMAGSLEKIDQSRRSFMGNIAHELRTPMTTIKGFIDGMLDGTIPPELHEKYLKIVLNETERLTKLTNSLLTLNNLNTRGMVLEKTDFDINSIIRNTAASFEGTCQQKHIAIELVLTGEQLFVNGDMGKIQQVLYNLLDNAIKFSHSDSVIKIETTEKRNKVFVSIKDSGIGIPKESLKLIWDRFYKTDLSRGKDKKGTGLGLSITREIIQAHNENINVISTEGVGTEFIFSLPVTDDEDE